MNADYGSVKFQSKRSENAFPVLLILSMVLVGCSSMKSRNDSTKRDPKSVGAAASTDPFAQETRKLEALFDRMAADFKSPGGKQAYRVQQLPGRAEIIGVYPVKAEELCYLVEMTVANAPHVFNLGGFTQAVEGRGVSFWQVPWLEVLLNENGTKVIGNTDHLSGHKELLRGDVRVAFFFHELRLSDPLLTPFGELTVPKPSKRPLRLKTLKYEAPD